MVRKTVTVLFADVAGSTSLGERIDPELLRSVLTQYYETARSIVERHGGTVEKFIGDAVMAVFGVPVVHEDDALRALRAAVELRDAELTVQLRIGVNTGEVVAAAGETLVTGDAVNVAARLEQAAGAGEILIGDATYRLARDAVRVGEPEPVAAKGKSEPVRARRLVAVLDDTPAFTRRLDAPFVGREQELARLEAALQRAAAGPRAELVTVLGGAGIGKSRLIHELIARTHDRARVVVGRCLSYGEGITYWPLVEIVRQLAGDADGLRELVGDELVAQSVAAAVGLGGEPAPIEETHWAARKLLEGLASERPLIVVLDDLHWAEPTFLDFVEYVAGFSAGFPILLVCTARSELLDARPSWTAPRANAETLVLEPLAAEESELLVDELLEGAELSGEDRRRVVAAAEGNPLFVEQLLALNADADGGAVMIPPTIHALLEARIDALELGERTVIDRGAVEGRLFHRGAVAELAPEEIRQDITSHLMALVRKELVRPDRAEFPGDDGFRFGHILIRDAVYEALPKALRAELHERFVRWLEGRVGDSRHELDEILGYHLERAVVYRREIGLPVEGGLAVEAGRRLGDAGVRAGNRGDLPAARSLLERAAELLPVADPVRVRLLPRLGYILFTLGDLGPARATLEASLAEAEASGDRARVLESRFRILQLALQTDPAVRVDDARADVDALRAEVEELGDPRLRLAALDLEFVTALMGRTFVETARIAEAAVEVARMVGDVHEEGEAFIFVLGGHWLGATPVSEAFRICERWSSDERTMLHRLAIENTIAGLESYVGKFDQARARIGEVRRGYADLGLEMIAAGSGLVEGMIELVAGDAAAAEVALRDSCESLRAMGETGYLSTNVAYHGEALYRLGRLDEAEAASLESEQLAGPGDLASQGVLRLVRAKVLARRGRLDEAESLAREALAILRPLESSHQMSNAHRDLAEVLALAGKRDEAQGELEQAIAVAEAKEAPAIVAPLRERLAALAQ